MDNSQPLSLVFIHGVGGAPAEQDWLTPLGNAMAALGHSRPRESGVGIYTLDYREVLLHPSDEGAPATTWRRSDSDHEAAYRVKRAEIERIASRYRKYPPHLHLGLLGAQSAEGIAQLLQISLRELRTEARAYRTIEQARNSVLTRVLKQLPQRGRVVLVAHSLGSVVAADLIKRLPADVTIDLLLTVGSPLPLQRFWSFVELNKSGFPFDRLKCWANVFDSLDPVTIGRGLGGSYGDAVDVDVHLGSAALVSNHAAQYYLSLPVVGALVGQALFGSPSRPGANAPVRPLDKAWDLYLLGAAYASQVSATCDGHKHRWKRKFDAARHASVQKLLAETDDHGALPATAREVPTETDFLDRANSLVKGIWSDEALIPYAVALLMTSPVRPYEISVDQRHAAAALASLLDRVRQPDSSLADHDFAKALADCVDEAQDALNGRGSLWGYLLLGGAAVIAATGVGVWAAMPAGVAGAALLTSTLAAFGPGGMVGGMITIAAASGVGSALVGAGAAGATGAESKSFRHFTDSLASLSPHQLKSTLIAMIAVGLAQERLSFPLTVEQSKTVLTSALTHIVNEQNAHLGLSSTGAKPWSEKRRIVEKALAWFNDHFPTPSNEAARSAMEDEHSPLRLSAGDLVALVGDLDTSELMVDGSSKSRALPTGSDLDS